jgi:hypothetical protein
MKKFALICLFATMAFMANAQNETPAAAEQPEHGAKIRFEEMEHQYGTIQKGGNGDCEFTFWNDGDEPLILQTVKASCGCTTPKYTQKPVMPGQKGTIGVHYNTNNVGGFSKTVTVTSNAVNNQRVVLRIKGNVQADPDSQVKDDKAKIQVQEPQKSQPQPIKAKEDMKPVKPVDAK